MAEEGAGEFIVIEEIVEISTGKSVQLSSSAPADLPSLTLNVNTALQRKSKRRSKKKNGTKRPRKDIRTWNDSAHDVFAAFDEQGMMERTRGRTEMETLAFERRAQYGQRKLVDKGEAIMRKLVKLFERRDFEQAIVVLEKAKAVFLQAGAGERATEVSALVERSKGDHLVMMRSIYALRDRDYDLFITLLSQAREHYMSYFSATGRLPIRDSELRKEDADRLTTVTNIVQKTKAQALSDGQIVLRQGWTALGKNDHKLARELSERAKKSFDWAEGHVLRRMRSSVDAEKARRVDESREGEAGGAEAGESGNGIGGTNTGTNTGTSTGTNTGTNTGANGSTRKVDHSDEATLRLLGEQQEDVRLLRKGIDATVEAASHALVIQCRWRGSTGRHSFNLLLCKVLVDKIRRQAECSASVVTLERITVKIRVSYMYNSMTPEQEIVELLHREG
jgi:hypothetical protein